MRNFSICRTCSPQLSIPCCCGTSRLAMFQCSRWVRPITLKTICGCISASNQVTSGRQTFAMTRNSLWELDDAMLSMYVKDLFLVSILTKTQWFLCMRTGKQMYCQAFNASRALFSCPVRLSWIVHDQCRL
jgi:hypothetical protein